MLCGSGCYQAVIPIGERPTSIQIELSGGGQPASSVTFALPALWPAPQAAELVRTATAAWRRLRSLVIDERLGSSPNDVLHTVYQLQAPDKLSYQVAGAGASVIIGARRWDRQPGHPWKESPMTATLTEPALQWAQATNAHLIGSATVASRAVWVVSFYDPSFHGFFEIWVDRRTLHTLELSLIAAAHFMHHSYSGFNAPLRILPPK